VNGTGSESCPVEGFGFSGVDHKVLLPESSIIETY
jgi:hypothetical protein